MKYIYIAGPYSKGDVCLNVREAIWAADRLLDKGFVPYIPHLTHFWHLLSPKEYEIWTALDMEWLIKCDAVLRLLGDSKGADEEVRTAHELNIPVFYMIEAIVAANE